MALKISWSLPFGGLTLALPRRQWCWNPSATFGMTTVNVVQQPKARNGYTLINEFDDLARNGDDDFAGSGFLGVKLGTNGRFVPAGLDGASWPVIAFGAPNAARRSACKGGVYPGLSEHPCANPIA